MEMKSQIVINRPDGKAKLLYSLILSFAYSLITLAVFAQSPQALYTTANAQYKAGQYEQAANGYENILSQGYKNAEVYYNLGNCYYKLNSISKSILNYERALNLSPGDEDIQHNLKLANLHITDKIQPVPQMGIIKSWNSFVGSNSSHGWTIWSMALIWLALLAWAVYLLLLNRKVFVTLGVLLVLLSLSAGVLAYRQNGVEHDSNMAILTTTNVFAKSAPDENGNNLFMLNEGIKFRILDEVGTWEKIRLADGRVGWIEKGSFEKI